MTTLRGHHWTATIDGSCRVVVRIDEDEAGRVVGVSASIGPPGSALRSALEALCEAITIGLKSGVALGAYTKGLAAQRFAPCGQTTDPLVPECSSVVDYLAKAIDRRFSAVPGGAS